MTTQKRPAAAKKQILSAALETSAGDRAEIERLRAANDRLVKGLERLVKDAGPVLLDWCESLLEAKALVREFKP